MNGSPPRRPPRESGPAPRGEGPSVAGLELETHHALDAAAFVQASKEGLHRRSRSARLSRLASDLELAIIEKRPPARTNRLCLDIAALALRILEQGD